MSTPLTDERLAEIRAELDYAGKELGEICKEGPSRRWRMRIPANADDSDLVLSAAIVAGEELLAEVKRLKADRDAFAMHLVNQIQLHKQRHGHAQLNHRACQNCEAFKALAEHPAIQAAHAELSRGLLEAIERGDFIACPPPGYVEDVTP